MSIFYDGVEGRYGLRINFFNTWFLLSFYKEYGVELYFFSTTKQEFDEVD